MMVVYSHQFLQITPAPSKLCSILFLYKLFTLITYRIVLTLFPFHMYRKKLEILPKIENVVPSKIEEEIGLATKAVFERLRKYLKDNSVLHMLYVNSQHNTTHHVHNITQTQAYIYH